jgi:hypothetical protein
VAIIVVQTAQLFNTFSGSFSSPVVAGNSIFLLASCYNASGATIISSNPLYNGLTPAGSIMLEGLQSPINAGDSVYGTIWMLPDVAGGGTTVALTITQGSNVSSTGLVAMEVSGLGNSPALDQSASDNGNSVNPTSGTSGVITTAPELILAIAVEFAVAVVPPGSPWINHQAGADYTAFGYQIAASSGSTYTYATTSTSAAPWSGMLVTVKGAGSNVMGPAYTACMSSM